MKTIYRWTIKFVDGALAGITITQDRDFEPRKIGAIVKSCCGSSNYMVLGCEEIG